MANPFLFSTKHYQTKNKIKNYLQLNFDIDNTTFDIFITFFNKSLHEKIELYKKQEYKIIKPQIFLEDMSDSESDSSTYSTNEYNEKKNSLFPNIEFEDDMFNDYNEFLQILNNDGQDFLFNNTKIDDFYRLFANYYEPIF